MIPEICLMDLLQEEKNAVWNYNNALSKIDFRKKSAFEREEHYKKYKKEFPEMYNEVIAEENEKITQVIKESEEAERIFSILDEKIKMRNSKEKDGEQK